MHWPQITVLVLMSVGMLCEIALHGKERKGEYNGVSAVFRTTITAFLLYKGGFFQ